MKLHQFDRLPCSSLAIFDSYKKRVCAYCLYYYARGSLALRCTTCDQVYFCSRACMRVYLGDDANGREAGETHHERVCVPLRRLATLRADRHLKSIVKLMLHVLWERKREEMGLEWQREERWWRAYVDNDAAEVNINGEGDCAVMDDHKTQPAKYVDAYNKNVSMPLRGPPMAAQVSPMDSLSSDIFNMHVVLEEDCHSVLPALKSTYALAHALQSHYNSWPADDIKDWRKHRSFLQTILDDAGLLREGEGIEEIMYLASKIESNGFGLYAGKKAKTCNIEEKETGKKKRKESEMVCFGRVIYQTILAALYPYASFFNHDCGYNCDCEQEGEDSNALLSDIPAINMGHESNIVSKGDEGRLTPTEIPTTEPDETPTRSATNYPVIFPIPRGAHRSMTITATRDIIAGTDLTITYIDSNEPVAVRRAQLREDYYFECQCEKCIAENTPYTTGKGKGKGKGKERRQKKEKSRSES
ncbi:hypothetical protein BC936DRAFT_145505 [Jimgerdemannia flammicorona]|uniref:SET domain-containing protein n=1 Tax=Jimgerdemannia flammicorona TaxID=994334 RepID=A0A433D9U7_9FUNG|nr:hypothetical protein BC936DRAFT_145505 [Jimgerdemannia flammicorona]